MTYPIPRVEVLATGPKNTQWHGSNKSISSTRNLKDYPKAKALFDYEAEVLGDLTLKVGDIIDVIDKDGEEGWWTGVIGNRQGLFPSTYVESLDCKPMPRKENEPKEGHILIAKFDYNQEGQEELSFHIGDKIVLMDKDESGWWLGKLDKTGVVGWFAPKLTTPVTHYLKEQNLNKCKETNGQKRKINGSPEVTPTKSNSGNINHKTLSHAAKTTPQVTAVNNKTKKSSATTNNNNNNNTNKQSTATSTKNIIASRGRIIITKE